MVAEEKEIHEWRGKSFWKHRKRLLQRAALLHRFAMNTAVVKPAADDVTPAPHLSTVDDTSSGCRRSVHKKRTGEGARGKGRVQSLTCSPLSSFAWLRCCLNLLAGVPCLFAPDFTSPLHIENPLISGVLFLFFFYFRKQNMYIWLRFALSKAMIFPGCCSQSAQGGWLAGHMLHIPWAQDLLLVLFCWFSEMQMVLCALTPPPPHNL